MSKEPTLIHERIDDIPLLIGLAQKLRLAEIMDKHLGSHGNHEGLSNGTLAIVWIAYILSEQNHKKVQVQEWSIAHKHTLEILLNQPIRDVEFSDDRLGIVLRRLSDQKTWEELQSDLWKNTAAVYEIEEVKSVRLDTTTVSGYHEKVEEGIMQNGHSKNHRPDLPQIKLMAACAEPSGHLLGCNVLCNVLPGNKGDEPLYVPMIERMQKMLGRNGLLYAGDSKMAAIETRAKIVGHQDYYLMPLPMIGETAQEIENWIGAVVDGTQEAQMIWRDKELLGGGYEFSRELSYTLEEEIHWIERVQIVRSYAFAQPQIDHLEKRLAKAKQELQNLTPAPGRGKRQYKEETSLQEAVSAILEKYKVVDLLSATWDRQEITQTHYTGRGRGGANRPTHDQVKVRYQITQVVRNEVAIEHQKHFFGWRVLATNMPAEKMSLSQTTINYRKGVCLEQNFHYLKDRPIGISPLYVQKDDQIIGLTHLLILALSLMTLIQCQVHQQLVKNQQKITGIYSGQPKRSTENPTAVALLQAISRQEPTLTYVQIGSKSFWHLTPLSDILFQVLSYLKLSPQLYLGLTRNSA